MLVERIVSLIKNKGMVDESNGLFIVWNPFQRRSETLANIFHLDPRYIHFAWEERGKILKVLSYIPKFFLTLGVLFKHKPRHLFIQIAPTPLLYTAALYKLFSGCKIISDCHNTMIYDDHWIKWPLAKTLLRWSDMTLVHNSDVKEIADHLHISTYILRDPLPLIKVDEEITEVAGLSILDQSYVIIPCGVGADEPLQELFGAIRMVPDILFVMTWFKEKLPSDLRTQSPENLLFTGFLPEKEFNALFSHATATLVLSNREGTQPSGAAEAISLGIPLIVSRLNTTQRLYKDAPIYVDNNEASISDGVAKAIENSAAMSESIEGLRGSLVNEVGHQIAYIKEHLE